MSRDRLVLMFAKAPQIGRVKTRLAKDVGPKEALRLYERMALRLWNDVLALRANGGGQVWLCFDPPDQADPVSSWLPGADRYLAQVPGDLGHRLTAAFLEARALEFRRIAVVGMDSPELSTEVIEEAFSRVPRERIVVGPAPDGGFYLLAMACPGPDPRGLFQNVQWSSERTLKDVSRNARMQGIRPFRLTMRPDIDTLSDLETYRRGPSQLAFPL